MSYLYDDIADGIWHRKEYIYIPKLVKTIIADDKSLSLVVLDIYLNQ